MSVVTSQTFSGNGGQIPDDGNAIEFSILVQNLIPSTIDTANFGLETICINLNHTWDADLDIRLIAPDGTSILLTSGIGGSGQNYSVTCFNNHATASIMSGHAPFNGTFRPLGWLGKANNGQNANGTWKLRILDTYPWADTGILYDWNITFGSNPSGLFNLYSSDIPIIVINSNQLEIPDEPKIDAMMGIIHNGQGNLNFINDPFNDYSGHIAIEMRGSSSQYFPKKSYAFETRDEFGNNNNVNLLGLPKENDWLLIANFTDKSLMRNSFTYDKAREMGYWAPRSRYCELVINGEYLGVYSLMESVKLDDDRIDIAELLPDSITGDALTGGYILKIDKWTGANNDGWQSAFLPPIHSNGQTIFFMYHYPKPDIIVPQQKAYIQNFINQFETTLNGNQFNDPVNGYYQYIDIQSFVDYFIINELAKNVDGYRLSTFLHKDRDSRGGKLTIGPVWDFDLAYRNADYCGGDDYTGWAYKFGNVCPDDGYQIPFWWDRLLEDSVFISTLSCRWQNLRISGLDTTTIFNHIDSVALYLQQAQSRNFYQWPILGIYIWPNPSPLAQNYSEEINGLKKWFRNRLHWLDNNMPGFCPNVSLDETVHKNIRIFPNPAVDYLFFDGPYCKTSRIVIYNLQNIPVVQEMLTNQPIFVGHLSSGMYVYTIENDGRHFNGKLVIQ